MTKETKETKVEEIRESKKVRIYVDPKLTQGGIRVNDNLFVGYVEVSEEQAKDLQRIMDEQREVMDRLQNPLQKIRLKNHFTVEKLFLADPATNGTKKGWTNEYGLLDPYDWQFLSEEFKQQLKDKRKALYGI